MQKFSEFPFKKITKFIVLTVYLLILWFIFPISIAIFFAYLIYPVVEFCHKRLKLPYVLSAISISILIFLLIYSLLYITVQSLISIYPEIQQHVAKIPIIDTASFKIFETIYEQSMSLIDSLVLSMINSLQLVFSYILEFFIFVLAFFFSLFESRKDRAWFFIYVPKSYRFEWKQYFTRAIDLFGYFLFVGFQLFMITFFLLSCGFSLLKFEQPISKAFIIAMADFLPFFGIGIFLVPVAIYFIVIGQSTLGIAVLVLFLFIMITRQITESMLWAKTFQLRAIHSFFISAASILLFGIYGVLLSPFIILIALKMRQKSTY
ncbi:AI-2E family transporter [Ureibacillus manganicus]|nr:AI-2E family transporter [Ureibacillus manganicus]